MKRLLAVFVMLALPAAAQENRPAAGAGGGNASGNGPHASAGPSGGGAAKSGGGGGGTASGGAVSGGGSGSGAGSGSVGAGRADTGGRHAASGGSGVAVTRNPERGSNTNAGRHGDAGAISSGGTAESGSGATAAPRAAGPAADSARTARTGDGNATGVPAYARPRTGQPVIGSAVPRGSVPPAPGYGAGSSGISYYPWWWFGGAGLYGSYWGYGNYYGYNNYLGPGAYYGYSDPWFGGYPDAQDPMPSGGGTGGGWIDEGALRLKIKPRDAEVYVDGFYVGVVDDFDGMFQKLHIESGAHRIEVRAAGYEPLVFDVRITTDHATTYQGELKRIK